MGLLSLIFVSILSVVCFFSLIHAQQPYVGKATTNCGTTDASNSNSVLGYSCNGLNKISCQAYLVFRSLPPFNTVDSISTLLGSDPSQLSKINSVSGNETFETSKLVIVPVNCSCSGQYYQANTSYVIEHGNTYFSIANNTYQGLSTCHALRYQNSNLTRNLFTGTRITVPLRCACPTKNQSDVGVKYLLSYIVTWGDTIPDISRRFGVNTGRTLEANKIPEEVPNIYPFTTLLVPLENQPNSSQTIASPPPPPSPSSASPSPNSSTNKGSKKMWIYAVVCVLAGAALTLILGTVIFCMFFRKSKKNPDPVIVTDSFEAFEKPSNKKLDEESQDFLESMSDIAQSLKVYSFKELQAATDNFSPGCRIKGSIYRGTINGDFAAIKKVNGDVSNEINLLNKIHHSNLISLSGVCFNDGSWYLVYEYAVNGPLSDWIYVNNKEGKFLNWAQRIQIALDVATGLNYLDSFTNPPQVHKDIKSSNVLLDSEFRAKIANLALARAAQGQEGEFALTRHIVGTKGYMAPEYLENGLVSTKLDVYAFGVLMLEMLTGKEAAALYREENMHLSNVLNAMLNKEDGSESLRHFIDPSMQENYPLELAVIMLRLIDSCLKKDPSSRPATDDIVKSLSRILNASLTQELSNDISVTWGDTIPDISRRFGVNTGRTLEANRIPEEGPNIYPFTTLLVPLESQPNSSQTIASPPPPPSPSSASPSPNSSTNKGSKKTWIYAIVCVLAGAALTLILGTVIFCMFFRKSKKNPDAVIVTDSFEAYEKPSNKKLGEESQDFLESMSDIAQSLKVYSFKELQAATDNFSPGCWIKGSIYRGTINGDFAAIKKVNGDVSNEINLLNKINHSNLISLSGVCFNDGSWYLVYEYAVNGPLSDWISVNNNEGKLLNWAQRIQIALDVATGLNYLHSFANPSQVHKDIKSSNVLLDSEFRAKIANLALARAAQGQEGEFALTRHIVGTKGYMAPEYLENGLVSTKLDVYAFGVLMLEMLTGKEAAALYREENMHLSNVLNAMLNNEDGPESLRHFIDPSMQENYPFELAVIMLRLIDSCLKKDPSSRPAMDDIVKSLSRILNASLTQELSNNISGY
ncbi:hypothetical protein LWI28_022611 [Acer negundo]|uniref:Uncharacterized protein n=1 Tax=Acer negundo TaxID=4023 RepID=A0AAD5IPF6_ACENE|nr:hypothetical protein LWI28_022611 [Acer negundo]